MQENSNQIQNVLIIGSGGREHAIGWKINQDNPSTQLHFCPGNGGTMNLGNNIALEGIWEMVAYAKTNKIDLTIVGPEAELVNGIVDSFQQEGLRIFGPNQRAAKLEGSKTFAKEFMQKHGVKTAKYQNFIHFVDARDYLDSLDEDHFPIVIKASGLAAGKGVVICHDQLEAQQTVRQMMLEQKFGEAGTQIVIEEFLEGFECSILSIFNGKTITPFVPAKDHKKIGEGEKGLNTGGMGVVAPNPDFTTEHLQQFNQDILQPTLKGLLTEQLNFAGIIFFGLMITNKGVYLLEYNLRFGDPETQAVLPLLDSNLLTVIQQSINQQDFDLNWKNQQSCCVVMASGGYPLQYQKGFTIHHTDKINNLCFVAGAEQINQKLITTGGRVLSVVALGDDLQEARSEAYKDVKTIRFDYNYYREDIGL